MFEHNAAKNLSIGDTIGQCFAADFTEKDNNKHPYTISAKTSGMIAILPLSDIKSESRKNPEAIYLLSKIAADRAFETVFHNVHGAEHNPVMPVPNNGQMNKDLRDFLFKDPCMRAFFRGCEKREERMII